MKTLHKSESLVAKLVCVPIGLKSRAALWQVPALKKRVAGVKKTSNKKKTVGGSVWMQVCSTLTSLTSASKANGLWHGCGFNFNYIA